MAKRHPTQPFRPDAPALYWSSATFLSLTMLTGYVFFELMPPSIWFWLREEPRLVPLSRTFEQLNASSARSPQNLGQLIAYPFQLSFLFVTAIFRWDLIPDFLVRILATYAVARSVSKLVFRRIQAETPKRIAAEHVSGPRPFWGGAGVASLGESFAAALRHTGKGISLAPGLALPINVEKEGILLVGRPGSGKSVILEGLMHQAFQRGDRVIALDVKGKLPFRIRKFKPWMLGLGGRGCSVWAIGLDLRDDVDTDEFAALLIPASSDPVWSSGSRLIFSALIKYLQARFGSSWGWSYLQLLLQQPVHKLEPIIRKHAPGIANLIETDDGAEQKAFILSLIFNLIAHVDATIQNFAALEEKRARRLSLRAWARPGFDRRPIVLRFDLQRRERSAAFVQLALRLLSSTLLGDDIPDGEDTRTWVFLDEVTRIGRCDALIDLSALGRSRGVRVVPTVQSPAQLRDKYDEAGAEALRENFGLSIVCGLPPGDNAKRVSDNWIGSRMVAESTNVVAKDKTPREWTIPVLSPSEIAGELGHGYDISGRSRIRAAVIGQSDVAVLDWSFRRWPRSF